MRVRWEDLNARARGLATHLADAATLDGLARVDGLEALAAELGRRGLADPGAVGTPTPAAVERALARRRGERTALVGRWAGERSRHLAAVFLEEDRRSVRHLVRGAMAGAPPGRRLAGLCPTPSLTAERLDRLSRARELGDVAAGLEELDHPFAPPVRRLTAEAAPDLFALDVALGRAFRLAAEPSWRAGRMRGYWADAVDLENAWTALLADGLREEVDPSDAFVGGGARLDEEAFEAIFREADGEERRRRLARALAGRPAGEALAEPDVPAAGLPRRVLDARIREERRAGRAAPHTPAPLLEYLLRLRAEAIDLRRLVWALALDAPTGRRRV